jgi:hypothetical protein
MFHPTRYARHRLTGVIRSRRRAGESIAFLARDLGLCKAAIMVALKSTPDDDRMTKREMRQANK